MITLLLAGAVAIVVALSYGYVGLVMRGRPARTVDGRKALDAFAVWWLGLAVTILPGALLYVAAAFGFTDLALQLTYAHLQRLALVVALVGLMRYLGFVVWGRDLLRPATAFYALVFVFSVFTLHLSQPVDVLVTPWRTDLVRAATNPGWVRLVSFLVIVVPPVVGALAYFRVFFRVEDRSLRYRVALVSWTLVVWWVVGVVAGQRVALGFDEFQLLNRVVGLFAALVIVAAYRPPLWVRRRWGVERVAGA